MSGSVPDVLVDTDVFVDHLRGARRFVQGEDRVAYSVVTRCELYAGTRVDEELVDLLLSPFTEVPISREIAERAGRIRRQKGCRTPDALIAACALESGFTLVTRNLKDFQGIPGLVVRLPSERLAGS